MSAGGGDREDGAGRWQALQEAFARARELDESERARFLDELAREDPGLAAEVSDLIAADESGDARFETPDFGDLADDLDAASAADWVGTRVGPFEIESVISSGGMGDVLLARRATGDFEQRVAVKVLREGLQHGSFAERFAQECRTLAQLRHPNIARFLDGGRTPRGLPYLVMEYVEGEDLLDHAERAGLDRDARLRLIETLCAAVQYAHQRLVVHRDVKPANVRVTPDGIPVLLDFGIAKLLDPEAADAQLTAPAQQVLTPEYASPEQLRGEAVGTASDLYSLGVVLYRLLSGRQPYDLKGRTQYEMARLVEEEPVPRLRDADPRAHADLDAIVGKCLRKEPERRYASAAALAEDLRRFRAGWPVTARPDSVGYRVRRFVGRNRFAVTALAIAVLVGGVLGAGYLRQQERAYRKALTASRVSDFLVEVVTTQDPWATGLEDVSLPAIFRGGVERAREELRDEPAVRTEFLVVLGRIVRNLGDDVLAADMLTEALESDPALARRDPALHAELLFERARARYRAGELAGARADLEASMAVRRRVHGAPSAEVAACLNTLGVVALREGDAEAARARMEEALEMRREVYGAVHPEVAETLGNLAAVAFRDERVDEALARFREALDVLERAHGPRHPDVATMRNNLGMALLAAGKVAEAEEAIRAALEQRRALLGDDHPHVAGSLTNLGLVHEERGDADAARRAYEKALAIAREHAPPGHWLRERIAEHLQALPEG